MIAFLDWILKLPGLIFSLKGLICMLAAVLALTTIICLLGFLFWPEDEKPEPAHVMNYIVCAAALSALLVMTPIMLLVVIFLGAVFFAILSFPFLDDPQDCARAGIACALLAFLAWGVFMAFLVRKAGFSASNNDFSEKNQ